jgi:hypothetical protein
VIQETAVNSRAYTRLIDLFAVEKNRKCFIRQLDTSVLGLFGCVDPSCGMLRKDVAAELRGREASMERLHCSLDATFLAHAGRDSFSSYLCFSTAAYLNGVE